MVNSPDPVSDALNRLQDKVMEFAVARDDLIVLTSYMAESGDYDAKDIAYAVEKPHSYVDVLAMAQAVQRDQVEAEVAEIGSQEPLAPDEALDDGEYFKKLALVPNPNADYAYFAGCGGQEPVKVLSQMGG